MKKVLVTGATGFIGRQALEPLLERGYDIHATYHDKPLDRTDVTWHRTNLLAKDEVSELLQEIRPTHLLHFAWYVNPRDYKVSPENSRWKDATLALVRAFRESGGTRAILAGTCMEYDWNIPQLRFTEDTSPVGSTIPYGIAKDETRIEAQKYANASGLSFAWGRIFNLFGPFEAESRLMPRVINSLLGNVSPRIPTGGFVRDYSYVKDTAAAFAALSDSDFQGAVNIGSGEPITLRQIAVMIADMLGKRDILEHVSESLSDAEPERIVADVARLRTEIGWAPRYTLHTGLGETIDWWRHRHLNDTH